MEDIEDEFEVYNVIKNWNTIIILPHCHWNKKKCTITFSYFKNRVYFDVT